MRNTKYILATMTLAAILSASVVSAQESSTPQSIERKKMESLWFSNTDNAAGAQLDNMGYYSQLGIHYNQTDGDLKRSQEGNDNTTYGFSTDGGGVMDQLGGTFLWGYFDYTHDKIRNAEYNVSLIDPLRGTPFYVADENVSDWINMSYKLGLKAASPIIADHWIVGVGLDYENAQGAKQMDPRPLVKLSKFEIKPSIVYTAGKHAVGADFSYYSRREQGRPSNSVGMTNHAVWECLYPGFFTISTVGIGAGETAMRDYNANSMGGGLQYSLTLDQVKFLFSGNYTYVVEDASVDVLSESYTTFYPKTVGTTKENIWDFSANVIWDLDQSNSLFAKARYYDRSIDGIEYVQVFNTSASVAAWEVISSNIRSNFSTQRLTGNLDYMNKDDEGGYRWLIGGELEYEKLSNIYYIPISTQQVEGLKAELYAKKNFAFGDNAILVGLRGDYSQRFNGEYSYTGNKADSEIYTDMVLRDYNFLCQDSYAFGGELGYTRKGIFGDKSSLFATFDIDYREAIEPIDTRFDNRMCMVVKVGLTF